MYNTLRELKRMERYYNKFVIKQNYERCYDDIQKDNNDNKELQYNAKETMMPLVWFAGFEGDLQEVKDWELNEFNN